LGFLKSRAWEFAKRRVEALTTMDLADNGTATGWRRGAAHSVAQPIRMHHYNHVSSIPATAGGTFKGTTIRI